MLDNDAPDAARAEVDPEVKARRQAARRLGRIVIEQSFRAAHPEADNKEVKAAVAAAKTEQVKLGRKVMKAMEKAGMTLVVDAAAGD